ncbi:MAG: hypothetical protein K1X88_15905 [Nannocystaceae bacterium]|nr:hypothetical protein [Nannocystaceae bacterium]
MGNLARHPEIRWQRRHEDIAAAADRQRRMLAAVLPLVRPGGALVYAVCSGKPEEGPAVAHGSGATVISERCVAPRGRSRPPTRAPPEPLRASASLPSRRELLRVDHVGLIRVVRVTLDDPVRIACPVHRAVVPQVAEVLFHVRVSEADDLIARV